ncbi:hypothetical protein KRR55_16985 [Paeniglutamicibacter sp. ABSL32-1]|uniref:hypothetical protein n=1 Tax=Paeniglutamicibacter quisquiliarum TaxID=2849498 RepID=UPI001C2D8015|nr:hypothetical protein [Paeniglutamicibacter quisquiliarum]MBV1780811.1 hypothetical protein [Paeniglutamicibacter quisquiliarum]
MSENDFHTNYPPESPLRGPSTPQAPPDSVGDPRTEPAPRATTETAPPGVGPSSAPETMETRNGSGGPADGGKEAAGHLGETARSEARQVARDVKAQGAGLLADLGDDVRDQASTQQHRLAVTLRQISEEFAWMLEDPGSEGVASSLVERAAVYSGNAADWLDEREPGDLLDEAKRFARQRPGTFLGLALGAGLLAGRMTRNAGDGTAARLGADTVSTSRGVPGTEPRPATPMPPTVNQTVGAGGVGGTGNNPGLDYPPPAGLRAEQGFGGS